MKNYIILFILLFKTVSSQDLFFSEYIEGSSYNKALEIYNPTDTAVDLSEYQLWQIANGGDWPEYTVDISGQLGPGEVFVVCHEDADPIMTAQADLLITLYHNGDDAQGLAKNDGTGNFALIDAIGESGEDPGSGWDVAGVSDGTKEHTLVRMPNVSQGNTDWSSSAGTNGSNSEWLVYPQNTFDYLGSHDYGGTVLIAEAGEDQFASPGDAVVLDGSGSVGDIIAYIWEQVSGTSVTINGGDNVVATFTAPADGGTLEFQLTVYDSDGNSEMDGTTVNVVSQVSIAEARSMGVGAGVMVEGVVIAPNFQEGNGNTEYVIQDETGGLVIFGGGFDAELNYGELVQVTGLTDEFNGKFEIIISSENDVQVTGQGTLPEPQLISVSELSSNGEDYESELITIQNATVTEGDWPAEGISTNLTIVDGGSESVIMRIDSDTDIDGTTEPSWPSDVTGVAGQYDSSEPYTEGYQLLPRFVSDFVSTGGNQLPVANAGEDQMVDPGVEVTLDGTGSTDPDGTIAGFLWEQISGETVSLSDYEEAVVTFTAPEVNTTMIFRLTVFDDQGAIDTDEVSVSILMVDQTIYDLQYSTQMAPGLGCGTGDECYPSSLCGQEATISGVVTAVRSFSSYPNFYLQDANSSLWSGIYSYVPGGFETLNVGDEVTVTAEVTEYYGFTELINISTHTVLSSGNSIEPTDVQTGDFPIGQCSSTAEPYEGVLVRVSNVEVLTAPDQYGSWTVTDGTGECKIDDYMFAGTSPSPQVGDQFASIVGVVDYSYSDYKIQPRGIFDLDDGSGPNIVSIYDIQNTDDQGSGDDCFPSNYDDELVSTSGTVTAVKPGDTPRFYLQDQSYETWSGIYVYDETISPEVGDQLTISAYVDEYFGFTELKNVAEFSINSIGNTTPILPVNTEEIGEGCSLNAEMYEGMLVGVSNVTVESINEYGEWYVNDGSGSCKIDNYFYPADLPPVNIGDEIGSISGVVDFAYGEYSILPRSEEDIDLEGGAEFPVSYNSGWNLVGVSMNVESFLYSDVFLEAVPGTMYGFNQTYISETEFNPGDGYWLYFDDGGSQSIAGQPFESVVVSLSSGWNLISGPSGTVNINNAIDPENIIIPGTLYGFDGTYVSTTEVQPGNGYWLNADSDGEVTLTTSTRAAGKTKEIFQLSDASFIRMNGIPLYFGEEIPEDKLNMFSLPPLPPENHFNESARFFDVRFADNRKVMSTTGEILVTGNDDEMTLSWSIYSQIEEEQWNLIDEFGHETSLHGAGETVLRNFGTRFLLQQTTPVPETFTLHQNFPNPFNPVTNIEFGIPEESHISILVFDLTGNKILTLFDGNISPGNHSVTWNGTNESGTKMSSGVYLYSLTSGSFTEMKKMIFIK